MTVIVVKCTKNPSSNSAFQDKPANTSCLLPHTHCRAPLLHWLTLSSHLHTRTHAQEPAHHRRTHHTHTSVDHIRHTLTHITVGTPTHITVGTENLKVRTHPARPPKMKFTPRGINPAGTMLDGDAASFLPSELPICCVLDIVQCLEIRDGPRAPGTPLYTSTSQRRILPAFNQRSEVKFNVVRMCTINLQHRSTGV